MSTKRLRQTTILEIVESMRIDSQARLVRELRNRGVRISQSTLSRDIQELGLAKAGSVYINARKAMGRQSDPGLRLVLRQFVTGIDAVEFFLIVKTDYGNAGPVAEALDESGWSEIAGTVAGDNTIFVLCRSVAGLRRIRARIEKLLA